VVPSDARVVFLRPVLFFSLPYLASSRWCLLSAKEEEEKSSSLRVVVVVNEIIIG